MAEQPPQGVAVAPTQGVQGVAEVAPAQGVAGPTQDTEKPKGVSAAAWEKFQKLKKKREEITKRSTEKRIKHLQKEITERVKQELNGDDEKLILQEHLSQESELGETSRGEKRKLENECHERQNEILEAEHHDWLAVRGHLGAHDHLTAASTSQHAPKSGLERELEEAIAASDYERADHLSDQLANRQFGVKIANAFDAKRFSERKKKEDDLAKARKQKKLNWRFEHKEKWEMKANM